MVPQPHAFPAFAFEATRFFGQNPMLLSYRNGLSRPVSRMIKAAIDITLASLMLSLSSFLFLILAVASRLDGGPMLFSHRRVGAGGRPFYCLKFRTMTIDADRVLEEALARDPVLAAEWEATRKLVDDPRVTRIGRILRKTSLDELPQLINVLRLEMSLVGPRPIVESEVPLYGEAIAQYYATRPGLTGLWQVSGRSNTSYARRVQLDVWYVNNWTVWNDIAVLLKTIPVVLRRQGAH
jgi:undecaprenyl-phosphate galactose phosphotransferase